VVSADRVNGAVQTSALRTADRREVQRRPRRVVASVFEQNGFLTTTGLPAEEPSPLGAGRDAATSSARRPGNVGPCHGSSVTSSGFGNVEASFSEQTPTRPPGKFRSVHLRIAVGRDWSHDGDGCDRGAGCRRSSPSPFTSIVRNPRAGTESDSAPWCQSLRAPTARKGPCGCRRCTIASMHSSGMSPGYAPPRWQASDWKLTWTARARVPFRYSRHRFDPEQHR